MDSRALQQALDLEFTAEVKQFISELQVTSGIERNFRFRALREISEALGIDELVRLAADVESGRRYAVQPLPQAAANG